jgi:hypothetical protein
VLVHASGQISHLFQAGIWAVFSLFTWHAWKHEWNTNVDYDIWVHDDRKSAAFAHSLMVAAMWVRVPPLAIPCIAHSGCGCNCLGVQHTSVLQACQ